MFRTKFDRLVINEVGGFVRDVLFPNCCFMRGMRVLIKNYWTKRLCDNKTEAMKCALGLVSECCPGNRL